MRLQDVVKRIEQGSRVPEVDERQRTLAWVRFFSDVERIERERTEDRPDDRQSGAA